MDTRQIVKAFEVVDYVAVVAGCGDIRNPEILDKLGLSHEFWVTGSFT
jgi:hypothetical protein